MASSLQYDFFVLVLLFSVGVTSANTASKLYWKAKLPNTLMPNSLIDSLAAEGNFADLYLGVGRQLKDATTGCNGDVWLSTHNKEHKWTHSDEVMLKGYEGGGHCHTDAMPNRDDITSTFFLAYDITMGSELNVHFNDGVGSVGTRYPSPALARAIPSFQSSHLSNNLEFFNAKRESDAAMFMNMTLFSCDHTRAINGKNQYCATSLQNLVDYVTSTLRGSHDVRTISASPSGVHRNELLKYKVVGVRQVATEKNMVACHRLGFPYAVDYCHQPKGTTAYTVTIIDVKNGIKSDVNAVCHSQTSEWSPDYLGFKILKVKPGAHVCHFLKFHDLIWFRG